MQKLITYILILGSILPWLCVKLTGGEENTAYNVMNYGARGDGRTDDAQAFKRTWQQVCGSQGTSILIIPPNKVFLVKNIIFNGPCMATKIYIQLQGKIVAPERNAWLGDPESALILISNVNGLTMDGSGGGLIEGYGQSWWKCTSCQRPKVLAFNDCNYLTVTHLTITNSPKAHISIVRSKGATFSNILISSPGYSPNTDGFDISSSTYILIKDSTIKCGDDCIALGNGCSHINITGIACGPGHGISIGSLGRSGAYETVEQVHVQHCNFTRTENGARIKTLPGGSGYARNIIFENIMLTDVKNPIIIDQYYSSFSGGVIVSGVTYRGFRGTSATDIAINLYCSASGCFYIALNQVYIGPSLAGHSTSAFCKNAHGTAIATIPTVSCLLR